MPNTSNKPALYSNGPALQYIIFLFFISVLLSIAACSTGKTHKNVPDLSAITLGHSYQVRVRSGNLAMDRIIYTSTHRMFGSYVPITENHGYSGIIEVVFTSTADSLPATSKAAYKTNVAYGNTWYTGSQDAIYPVEDEIGKGGLLTWQNSKMSVTIKNLEGETLWNGQYAHKGGEEYKDVLVKTADEAAALSLERIISMFRDDYNIPSVPEDSVE